MQYFIDSARTDGFILLSSSEAVVIQPFHIALTSDRNGLNATHPQPHKLFMQHHPGEEVDEADVGSEERDHLGAAEDLERVDVKVVGQNPEEAEQAAAAEELPCNVRSFFF